MIALGFVMVVGFISLLRDINMMVEKYDFLIEFRSKFVKFAISYFEEDKLDSEKYQWLLENVDEASSALGGMDTMTYKPAFANYVIPNYQLLINLIPSFNSSMGAHHDDATSAQSILTRVTGSLKKYIDIERKKLRNPINWLIEGLTVILSTPLLLLKQFGILSKNTYGSIRGSRVFHFIVGVVGLISTIDAIYVIVTGDSFTVELIKNLAGFVLK